MARKRKTSPAEDLIDLIAMLPWWAGIGLAIVSYLILHAFAFSGAEPTPALQPGQIGQYMSDIMVKWLAYYGQFIAPLFCLIGAALSAWRRKQRKALIADVAQGNAADALNAMSWREFEMLIGEAFRLQGYQVAEIGGHGADGGVDLVLTKNKEKFFVQCKQWKAFKVGVDVVRQLYGVMAANGAAGGFVVTSGRFTEPAAEFARGRNLQLIDGPAMLKMIKQARATRREGNHTVAAETQNPSLDESVTAPTCPVCANTMVRRSAKRGANAGRHFWGCAGYPACKGIRPIG